MLTLYYLRSGGVSREVPLSGPDITEKEINAVVEVLRSGVLSIGP